MSEYSEIINQWKNLVGYTEDSEDSEEYITTGYLEGEDDDPLPLPSNEEEYQKLIQDVTVYGMKQTGSYRGVSYTAKRNGRDMRRHWCGYIHPNTSCTEEQGERIDAAAHGGLTWGIGFDCAHIGDYPLYVDGQFRDFPYVLSIIKAMIDALLDE